MVSKQSQNFTEEYYESQYKKGLISGRGNKPFFFSYWKRYLNRIGLLSIHNKLLDYGCGEGFWIKKITPVIDAYGMDISEYAVETSKRKTGNDKITQIKDDKINFKNDYFDVITAFDVIEHIKEPQKLTAEFYRILKKNGTAIITTPNLYSIGRRIKKDQWHGARDCTHISMKTMEEWNTIFCQYNFTVVRFGSDTFWDAPYVRYIPTALQHFFLAGIHNIIFFLFGFTSFKYGENAYFILKKL